MSNDESIQGQDEERDDEKHMNQFPNVQVRGLLKLPSSAARDFLVAVALGTWLAPDGSTRLRPGQHSIATLITPARREDVMDQLNVTEPSWWRKRVRVWVASGMAHRCRRNMLCLFLRQEDVCPNCNAVMYGGETSQTGPEKRSDLVPKAVRSNTQNGPMLDVSPHEFLEAKERLPIEARIEARGGGEDVEEDSLDLDLDLEDLEGEGLQEDLQEQASRFRAEVDEVFNNVVHLRAVYDPDGPAENMYVAVEMFRAAFGEDQVMVEEEPDDWFAPDPVPADGPA